MNLYPDSPDYNDTNQGDPRDTPEEKEISRLCSRLAQLNKLQQLTFDNQVRAVERADLAETQFEKATQWNALLELELSNLRQLKPVCAICEQLMEQRGEDGTDYVCVNCDRAYRESQLMLAATIKQREVLLERMIELDEVWRNNGVICWTGNGEPIV